MANQNENEIDEFDFTVLNEQELNNIEEDLNNKLAHELQDLENIDTGLKSIQNPDALGKVILDEVWTQFGNQIGLEITSETLIQQYDREHPEETKPYSKDAGDAVMKDPRYKAANKAMKEKQQSGNLKDEYTGKDIKQNDKANLDHTVSRKEIYENQRRKQAKKSTADLANMDENLNATNESLNKSKGAKSVDEMRKTRQQREKAQIEQNERAKKKIDESNMSDAEKKAASILDEAQKKSDDMIKNAKTEIARLEKASDDAVVQASRNMLLGFRDSLIAELNGIVQAETAKAYSKDLLKTLVPETVKAWSKNAEASELSVLLSEKDCKELEDELKSALKAEIAKGLEVKADKSLAAGFRIGVNNGAAYYDYSAESVAELFSAYLNPRVAALMKEAAKGTN